MKDNDKMSTLEKLRISCGYTQKRLADESGVSARTIQNYEAGCSHELSSIIKRKLSTVLECPPDAIDNEVVCDCWVDMHEKLKQQQKLGNYMQELSALRDMVVSLTQEVQSLRKEVSDLKSMKSDIHKIAKHFS